MGWVVAADWVAAAAEEMGGVDSGEEAAGWAWAAGSVGAAENWGGARAGERIEAWPCTWMRQA